MAAPLLILPIEEKNRELNSRVLIALYAIEAGYDVIIGQQWELFASLSKLPPSVVLFKGSNTVQARHMAEAKKIGHFICAIEEEIFALTDDREIRREYDPDARAALDLVLAQGDHQADVVARAWPEMADRIAVVGNPRADLLQAQRSDFLSEAARALRRRHGPFVLFNTNFGATNPAIDDIYGFFELAVRVGRVNLDRPADFQMLWDAFVWERANFKALTTLALRLAGDGVSVILRPHPSENTNLWHRQLADISGLTVVSEGSQLDWLRASSLLVHSGCATGLEAFLLNHPVLTLVPGKNWWHDAQIANRVNLAFSDIELARQAIHDHLDGKHLLDVDSVIAEAHLRPYLLLTSEQHSAEKIINEIRSRHRSITVPKAFQIEQIFASSVTNLSQRRASKVAFTRGELNASIQACAQLVGGSSQARVSEIGSLIFRLDRGPHDAYR